MATAVVALAAGVSGVAAPAFAADDQPLAAIASAAPEATQNVADVATTTTGPTAISAKVDGTSVTVPTNPRTGISIGSGAHAVSVALPFAKRATNAARQGNGIVSYDNQNGSSTVPLVKADGTVELTTVISSASAPSSYAYQLDIPRGATISQSSNGAVAVLDSDGNFVLGVAAPWARDAHGNPVPTSFSVVNNTLTQHVNLSAPGIAFPVVADPWLGTSLIDHEAWIQRPGGPTLEVYRTAWGFTWTGAVTWGAWWSELLSKVPSNRSAANTSYVMNQLDCHLVFAPIKNPFDLDTYIRRASLSDYVAHNCN